MGLASAVGYTAAAMQRPAMTQNNSRILRYRPRTSAHPPGARSVAHGATADLDLGHDVETAAEFRHRMSVNLAAFAFTVVLTSIGIWLAISIADLRKAQDCVLMGRRNCAEIPAPTLSRAPSGPARIPLASTRPED